MRTVTHPAMISNAARQGRVTRRPVHTWNTKAMPWAIQPVMIAPVIPGETMRSAIIQARAVTDPVKNRLMGWWHEYYLYYVPFPAMPNAEKWMDMVINPEFNAQTAGVTSNVAAPKHYFGGRNSIDWVKECLAAVVEKDFRNEGENWSDFMIDNLPVASVNRSDWMDSVMAASEFEVLDVDVDPGSDDILQASEIERAMQQYELLKLNGLVDMTYEQFLQSYGIRGRAVEELKDPEPELLRYIRDWTYPSNTADAEGNVASVCTWTIAERASKDRFFTHPGFIFMVSVSRPKVFISPSKQVSNASTMLDSLRDWLPAILTNDPYSSIKGFPDGSGPLAAAVTDGSSGTQGYYADIRDLLLYGDQFIVGTTPYTVNLPTNTLQRRYAALADVAPLFTGEANTIEQDGICTLIVAGRQQDMTASRNVAEI